MANRIEFPSITADRYVDSSSRYLTSRVIYYGDRKLITFETYKRPAIVLSADDRFMVIPKGAEYRPDLVANKIYKNSSLWWKLLEANNMKDVFDFKSGVTIRVPNSLSGTV